MFQNCWNNPWSDYYFCIHTLYYCTTWFLMIFGQCLLPKHKWWEAILGRWTPSEFQSPNSLLLLFRSAFDDSLAPQINGILYDQNLLQKFTSFWVDKVDFFWRIYRAVPILEQPAVFILFRCSQKSAKLPWKPSNPRIRESFLHHIFQDSGDFNPNNIKTMKRL